MNSRKPASYESSRELYEKLVTADPRITLKGASILYTSLNGHMFSYLHPSGAMALRLPQEERESFLKTFKTKLFEAYGIVQKEYVTVPEALLEDLPELTKYFEISYSYVKSLKPKPTTKKTTSTTKKNATKQPKASAKKR